MQYDGNAKFGVPAKRCEQFITAFEKIVSEFQEKIKIVERNEQAYNIVKSVIDQCKASNNIKVRMHDSHIMIDVDLLPSNKTTDFDNVISEIGQKLFIAKLHNDGIPSRSKTSLSWNKVWALRIPGAPISYKNMIYITFTLKFANIVKEGCVDYYITETIETISYQSTVYNIIPRESKIDKSDEAIEIPF